ncbi:MAG: hypothetical protein ACP5NZ_01700 [Nanobdellota archaeon]
MKKKIKAYSDNEPFWKVIVLDWGPMILITAVFVLALLDELRVIDLVK